MICKQCQTLFTSRHWQSTTRPPKFCSVACARRGQKRGRRPAPVGARFKKPTGYIYIRCADGQWRAEHRVVMAQKLGRELRPHEQVHHHNADKTDNRPENLELWLAGLNHTGMRLDPATGMAPFQHD